MTRTAGTPAALALWLCAAATSALAPGAAFAQAAQSPVLNGQVTLGDVMATNTLHVENADAGATAQATAVGNVASAIGQDGDLSFTSSQRYGQGYMGANSSAVVDGSAGPLLTNQASATGNTATAGTCCGLTSGATTQAVDADATVYAQTFSQTGALSGQVSADASAIGNTQGWESANGAISAASTQTQAGHVQADNGASIQGGTQGEGGYSATAVSNDVSATATNASAVDLRTDQTMSGDETRAELNVSQLGGDQVITQATATGNNVSVIADGGAAALTDVQTNAGAVTAQSDLALDSWNSASSNAYGVGNSAILSNAGPSTAIDNTQTNTGAVTVGASFDGRTGGEAQVAATAVGNAVSAYACATCQGGVGATNSQTSNGPIHATASFTAGAVGAAYGGASAIGNTATFQVRSPGG